MPGQAGGVDAGDAIVSFLADTTQLDAALSGVGARATAGLGPVETAVNNTSESFNQLDNNAEDAIKKVEEIPDRVIPPVQKMDFSMREARGSIALLGEEVGVRLPRHLQTFVAGLPGVGAALESAFSAVAFLLLLNIIVEGAKKLSEFTAEMLFSAKAAQENMDSTKNLNAELLKLNEKYEALKKAVDEYGKSQVQLTSEALAGAKKSSQELAEQLKSEEEAYFKLNQAIMNNGRERLTVSNAWDKFRAGQLSVVEAITAVTAGETQQTLHGKELAGAQEGIIKTAAQLKVSQEQVKVSTNDHTEALKKQAEEFKRIQEAYDRAMEQLARANEEFQKLSKITQAEVEPAMTAAASKVQILGAALRALGNDTVDLERDTIKAQKDMAVLDEAYSKNTITVRQYALAKVAELNIIKQLSVARGEDQVAIDAQIAAYTRLASGLKQTNQFWDSFTEDFKKKAKDVGSESKDMAKTLSNAVAGMDQAFASAIVGALTSGASIGQALEKATKAILQQLATQALAKSMFYLAQGIAATASGDPAAAGYYAAAGEFAAVAALAGGASVAMGGGGSGSGGTPGTVSPITSSGGGTSSLGGGTTRNIQKFAEGGLITGPTLGILGESMMGSSSRPREAVLPLDNDEVMDRVGDALGIQGGNGDFHAHFHKGAGLISPDTLKKTMKQMSGMVKKRSASLHSTNTFRTQKRSS